jgi:hypothetical protein
MSTLAGYVSCAFFNDIGGDGIEFSFSCQADHQGQQGGFAKIVQIQAQKGDDRLGRLLYFAAACRSNQVLYLIFDDLARREVPRSFLKDGFDFRP